MYLTNIDSYLLTEIEVLGIFSAFAIAILMNIITRRSK